MIPALGEITRNNEKFSYQVAENKDASVHAGYMLGLSYLAEDVMKQIEAGNKSGIYTWFITGHSQGGSLAQLMRAYLFFQKKEKLSHKNQFKVYAFANPMIGNVEFCNEYKHNFADPGMSFVMDVETDVVPTMPMSYNDSTFFKSSVMELMSQGREFDVKENLMEGMMTLFAPKLSKLNQFLSGNVFGQITKDLGEIKMPEYRNEANFAQTCTPIMLPATQYPPELKDSSILLNDSLMRIYKRDVNGVFEDKNLYKKQSVFLQHKPYNYYTAILKVYFPADYERLDQKYFVLPEGYKKK